MNSKPTLAAADVRAIAAAAEAQAELLRQLAASRGEERPAGRVAPTDKGFMGKLRDAFKGV